MRLAIAGNRLPQGRRTKGQRDPLRLNDLHQPRRVDLRRARHIQVRQDGGEAEEDVEQGKERKSGKINVIGLRAKQPAQLIEQGDKHAGCVNGAFGQTGAAGRVGYGHRIIQGGRGQGKRRRRRPGQGQKTLAPRPAQRRGDPGARGTKGPRGSQAQRVGQGNADDELRLRFGHTGEQAAKANRRVNENRQGPDLEQGKGHHEQVKTWAQQEERAVARLRAGRA